MYIVNDNLIGDKKMYQILVEIKFEDGTNQRHVFDYWRDAANWVEFLANEKESLPDTVSMKILR